MEIQFTIFGIVILCFLYFPGLILKKFYFKGPFSKQFIWGPFIEKFLTSVFAGIFVHIIFFIMLWMLNHFLGAIVFLWNKTPWPCQIKEFNIGNIYAKMLSYFNDISKNKSPISSSDDVINFIQYWLLTCIISVACGYGIYRIVRALKFDIKFKIFRYANIWHYYFNGEIIMINNGQKLKEIAPVEEKIQKRYGTFVELTKESISGPIKYFGVLESYELLHSDCQLQLIFLKYPFIKHLNSEYDDGLTVDDIDPNSEEYLILPYDNSVKDIQLAFVYLPGGNSNPRKRKYTVWFFAVFTIMSVLIPLTQYQKIGVLKSFILMILIFLELLIVVGIFNYFSKKSETDNIGSAEIANQDEAEIKTTFDPIPMVLTSIIATGILILIAWIFIYKS